MLHFGFARQQASARNDDSAAACFSTRKTRSLTRKRFLTGLIGAPIAHSAAPAMHEQAAH